MRRYLSRDEVYPARNARVSARFISVADRQLRVIEAGNASAPTVVCVPGWASGAYQYRKNLPAIAAAGFRAITVELPGQGESDKPTAPDYYTLPTLARDLGAALDTLGVGECSIVAQSLGAAIATTFSRVSPNRVRRLALLAPVGLATVRLAAPARALLPLALAAPLARFAWRWLWALGLRLAYGKLAKPDARDVDEYHAPARDPAYVPSLIALIRAIDWHTLDDETLARLAMPVLVVCGSEDRLIRCRDVIERARRLPNARSVVIPGAGHALQEEAPEQVNRLLVDFLKP